MTKPRGYIPDSDFHVHVIEPGEAHLREAVLSCETVEQANSELFRLTHIERFFHSTEEWQKSRKFLLISTAKFQQFNPREFGDFQTPYSLAERICRLLHQIGVVPKLVVEPTCGVGSFVLAALECFPSLERIYGVEIQEEYLWQLKMSLLQQALEGTQPAPKVRIELHHDDFFAHQYPSSILKMQDVLILGNPPWVTSATLGGLNSKNLPGKTNLKSLAGLDALTGKSNFDINEWIVLEMLRRFSSGSGTLAMLCKNSVIKNIVKDLPRSRWNINDVSAYEINAGREFGAATAASLMVMRFGNKSKVTQCRISKLETPEKIERTFGWSEANFVADIENYQSSRTLDGICPWVWRQGIKHDCVAVMELKLKEGILINGYGEAVKIEDEWVYWLLKSSDLKSFEVENARRKVIITQRNLKETPSDIQAAAPRLWGYLTSHQSTLTKRKSRIYAGKPEFSIFGVGDYSFKPFKVAASGLYKNARFCLVPPMDGHPAMLDDTCYFLGFDCYRDALFTNSLLNSKPVQSLLASLVFPDAMRPFTKEVLMRVDLAAAACQVSFSDILSIWKKENYLPHEIITAHHYEEYQSQIEARVSHTLKFEILNQSQFKLVTSTQPPSSTSSSGFKTNAR